MAPAMGPLRLANGLRQESTLLEPTGAAWETSLRKSKHTATRPLTSRLVALVARR